MMRRLLLSATLLLVALLLGVGCHSTTSRTMTPAPDWVEPTDTKTFTGWEVYVQALAYFPDTEIYYNGGTYTLVNYEWLERFVDWTWQAAKEHGIGYSLKSFNCVNYTNLFNEIVVLKASQAGVQAKPLAATAVVGADGTPNHALCAVATDRGIYIIEPQPDAGPFRIWRLTEYQPRIYSLTLGVKAN